MGGWPRRAFLFGAWMTIVTAGLHALAHLGPPPPPDGPVGARLRELATTHQLHIMGVNRTMMNFMDGLGLSFSVLTLAWGVMSVLLARQCRGDWRAMRRATFVNALLAAGMLTISAIYFVPPPTACLALVTLGYVVALVPGDSRSV
jgi:hypothetical protein